jgi:synaptosomal-associated protein 25
LSSTGGFQEHHQLGDGPLKQEDALMDLSNVIGQLKDMSLQMHSEISRQNEDITYLDVDVHELNYRVKGANDRGRQLLRR